MDIIAKLRELLAQADTEPAADPIEEPAIREGDPPVDEAAATDPAGDADPVLPEAGEGVSNPEEAAEAEAGETLPASETSEAELRDALNDLGADNERLRNMVIDLGGDPDAEAEIDPEADPDGDDADEYDDDKATADIAEQKNQIAALLGN